MKFEFKKINIGRNKIHKKTLRTFVVSAWKSLLYTFTIIGFVVIIANMYMLWKISDSNLFNSDINNIGAYKKIDVVSLNKTYQYYTAKEERYREIRNVEIEIVDPPASN